MLDRKLILASQSPRRADILRAVGWPFEVCPAGIDEARFEAEAPVHYVERLARTKAATVAAQSNAALVLGADTVVVVDDAILGQPRDADDAQRMLRLLSGRSHDVLTGVCLMRAGEIENCVVDHERTRVRFKALSDAEIRWYVSTGEPLGKAGAYGIQGRAAIFVEEIRGDYFNIAGLPIRLVYELAQRI
jgi:septum formation protein